ncbi:hypothetical protein O4273_24005 [Rhodococcus ruber]|uniref:hypothetical protein n=1 Tax=Rhodococcus ruber TaxID=1830 RepID=UPI0022B5DB64|nr:hypothetical protein [Rhodococcus ruber]MCZ4505898.1 hypothetical protein [Rhodococcus ruber]
MNNIPAPTPAHEDPEKVAFLDKCIAMLRETDPDTWWEGPTFRSTDGQKHCALSHIADRFGMEALERFEAEWSTSYVIGALVNDEPSNKYPHDHPKDRVLAYLDALRVGTEVDVETSMWRQFMAVLGDRA